jgi:hypothetical protein
MRKAGNRTISGRVGRWEGQGGGVHELSTRPVSNEVKIMDSSASVVDRLFHSDAMAALGAARRGVLGGLGLLTGLVPWAEAELVRSGFVVGSLVETALVTDLGGVRNGIERRRREAIRDIDEKELV